MQEMFVQRKLSLKIQKIVKITKIIQLGIQITCGKLFS